MSNLPDSTDEAAPGRRVYRAFVLGIGGAIRSAIVLNTETDAAAKTLTAAIINPFGIELWERARFLATFPPLVAAA